MQYESIKEIREVGSWKANFLLEHDWVVLDVQSATRSARHAMSPAGLNNGAYYVRRGPIYVVGRPDGVETIEFPPFPQPKEPVVQQEAKE